MALLELYGVSKSFDGIHALQDVSFSFNAGEIHALCGENGAGKSTLMNMISGHLQPDRGRIHLNGEAVTISNPQRALDLGIGTVYQHLSLFGNLTVAENIFSGRPPVNGFGLIQYDALRLRSRQWLDQLAIEIDPLARVADLSAANKQMVEIAKALSLDPRILILDEPTASLTSTETDKLFAIIRAMRERGVLILYISHRLAEIDAIADRISILKDGVTQGTFPKKELSRNQLVKTMIGRELAEQKFESTATNSILLAVNKLAGPSFDPITFAVHRGEILGFAGLTGAGRSEIAKTLFGQNAPTAGTITVNGAACRLHHPADAVRHKIAYVPEDRKQLGLFPAMPVRLNILSAAMLIDDDEPSLITRAEQLGEQLHITRTLQNQPVTHLSGGNQQKVMLARWLLTDPEVFIADEPTHGIDIGSKAEVHTLLRSIAAQGKAIILISSELPELINLCDRIIVLRQGAVAGELSRADATEEKIMGMAAL